MTNTKTESDYMVTLLPFYAELFCAEGISYTLFALRFDALQKLQATLSHYSDRGYTQKLLCGIAERKAVLILAATGKTEMEKILKPHAPHYDGVKFVSDPYLLPEEELICWSEASLRAPLNEAGYRRYMKLFRQIFPEESEALQIA